MPSNLIDPFIISHIIYTFTLLEGKRKPQCRPLSVSDGTSLFCGFYSRFGSIMNLAGESKWKSWSKGSSGINSNVPRSHNERHSQANRDSFISAGYMGIHQTRGQGHSLLSILSFQCSNGESSRFVLTLKSFFLTHFELLSANNCWHFVVSVENVHFFSDVGETF